MDLCEKLMACGFENEGVDKFSVQISLLNEHTFSSRSLGERRLIFQRCLLWNCIQENFSKRVKQLKSLVLLTTSESHEWSVSFFLNNSSKFPAGRSKGGMRAVTCCIYGEWWNSVFHLQFHFKNRCWASKQLKFKKESRSIWRLFSKPNLYKNDLHIAGISINSQQPEIMKNNSCMASVITFNKM